ncbi:hypothetical protein E2C01_016831 [Portunus trituberculatus]|uniref:Uncharacterized protein n=1 Tax=Portunus trituberculatus TaxID=210409 RepID=A0A5B7DRP6_PORTR|nr:hypothetical protein [Portunus trituberculatus]
MELRWPEPSTGHHTRTQSGIGKPSFLFRKSDYRSSKTAIFVCNVTVGTKLGTGTGADGTQDTHSTPCDAHACLLGHQLLGRSTRAIQLSHVGELRPHPLFLEAPQPCQPRGSCMTSVAQPATSSVLGLASLADRRILATTNIDTRTGTQTHIVPLDQTRHTIDALIREGFAGARLLGGVVTAGRDSWFSRDLEG